VAQAFGDIEETQGSSLFMFRLPGCNLVNNVSVSRYSATRVPHSLLFELAAGGLYQAQRKSEHVGHSALVAVAGHFIVGPHDRKHPASVESLGDFWAHTEVWLSEGGFVSARSIR
jgi:hypothetical protein